MDAVGQCVSGRGMLFQSHVSGDILAAEGGGGLRVLELSAPRAGVFERPLSAGIMMSLGSKNMIGTDAFALAPSVFYHRWHRQDLRQVKGSLRMIS